jgi:predicted nuclease of predicted toxin-antitoxin system
VRVLLDEQLPRQLASELTAYEVRTVQQQGWAGLKNGELLQRAAEAGFEVFITADQNIEFQQNLATSSLFVLVLIAPSNALEDLLPLIPNVHAELSTARAGRVVRVHA